MTVSPYQSLIKPDTDANREVPTKPFNLSKNITERFSLRVKSLSLLVVQVLLDLQLLKVMLKLVVTLPF